MNDTIEIKVQQEDIDGATRGSPLQCPIARCLVRKTGEYWITYYGYCERPADPSWSRWEGFDIEPKEEALRFIETFDSGGTVYPTRFFTRKKQ